MKNTIRRVRQALALVLAALSAGQALAAPVPFSAQFSGQSDIVAVIDPQGPKVQVQTAATGTGVLGLLQYFSGDQIDLGTGQGKGSNRFVAGDGSELFGEFSVQLVPTADPAVMNLFGEVDFTGGTGRFEGASGWADFTGSGRFFTPVNALTRFEFTGELHIPEPAAPALALLALGLAARVSRPGGRDIFRARPCDASAA